MKKTCSLAVCLLTATAWAQPGEPSVSVWVQPVGTLAFGLAGPLVGPGTSYLTLPVGMNVPLSPTQELVFEVTPFLSRQDCEGPCSTRALALAVGSAWSLSPHSSRGSFFIQPKVMGLVSRDKGVSGGDSPWMETGSQLSLGLDVGYRVRSEHLFLAFVLGGSVGRGWNVPASSSSIFTSFLDWPQGRRESKWVYDLNLNLLRIGASF
ncbi:hypothetical protein JRI60_41905 [Archangium violaceum]|uniref:hypothetical protein n=1 Tax=Archangium violaceum TaxID=83451 RepID=UPI0019522F13|nr:hypothetical protein [Archangium violaceum]QRN95551.1 hypothetical protein JRI60_41905 [Archangium violaceum]